MAINPLIQNASAALNHILLGKTEQVNRALCCILSRGHLLVEDIPGMGKTTLSHALAATLGLTYNRIQFTSDLLPADVLGFSMYDKEAGDLMFHQGPIFAQVILADEINRASPRTQSALLEAMEERQVSIEGETRPLPDPFFVIATQNPQDQGGTFPLPESQLDRFLMRLQLGYPDSRAERELLLGQDRREMISAMTPALTQEQLTELQRQAEAVTVSDSLLSYVQRILTYSREIPGVLYGLSPRAGLGLLRATRAWALMDGRSHALPDDVQAILPNILEHRLVDDHHHRQESLTQRVLNEVPVIV